MLRTRRSRICLLGVYIHGMLPFFDHANAHEKNIAALESDVAFFGNLVDVVEFDGV
jgi:hypothetical protein